VWGAVLTSGDGLWDNQWPYWLTLAAGVLIALVLALLSIWYRRARFGELKVTGEFRTKYDALRRYLQECRTDRLWQLQREWRSQVSQTGPDLEQPARDIWASYFQKWTEEDDRLARRCAEQLDDIARIHIARNPEDSLERLRHRIERWALVALFATERPRNFYWFPVPRLTLLYSAYPVWSLFPQGQGQEGPPLVAESDLRLELRVHCRAHPEEVEWVRRWAEGLRQQAEQNQLDARTVLDRVAKIEVRAGAPRKESAPAYAALRPRD
jgi:hypothetical protein